MTLKGRFGFCVVCGNCGGAGRACGSGNGVRSNNVSIKIAAAIGYAYAKGAQNLVTARLSKQSTERDFFANVSKVRQCWSIVATTRLSGGRQFHLLPPRKRLPIRETPP